MLLKNVTRMTSVPSAPQRGTPWLRWSSAPLLALALLAAGCTTTPRVTDSQLQQTRAYATTVTLDGRLSIQYEVNGIEQPSHGSFSWVQHDKHANVQLLSPLGQVVAVITIDPGKATLTQSNRTTKTASDPDTLIREVIGWPLPVNGLQDWLQGFVTDGSGKRVAVKASTEPVIVTTQDGWRITYATWAPDSKNTLRPKRIDLSRKTTEAGTVSIRIVIDEWTGK